MANSKYEYVKSFEVEDEVMFPNLIIIRIDGRDFSRFSQVHKFEKPNDETALNLMNSCASSVLEEYPDIVFAYGYSDEYSFVFKKTSRFYQRRASKILSLVASFFAAVYVTKWKEFFPRRKLEYAPSFASKAVSCASVDVLQAYLAWRQHDCHISNQYDTCFWMLVKSGRTLSETQEILKDTQKQQRNELLFQQFGINYKMLPVLFRQGSCLFKTKVEETVKHDENGNPVKRLRRRETLVHSENIAGRSFWNEHSSLHKDLGHFAKDIGKIEPDYVKSFQFESRLLPLTWVVVRIDGCHFHRFSEVHEFEKPNDEQALKLMNSCAVAVLEEFQDIAFAYGVSDEYSFVLKNKSELYKRQSSKIISAIVSFFTSTYVMRWGDFFPHKKLKYSPSFDGRAVCYPTSDILLDYLAWRQVDCHINNQYNTCFWMLVKSGKSKTQAQDYLKGTQTREKNELLSQQFGIEYNSLAVIFRMGSSVFRLKTQEGVTEENGEVLGKQVDAEVVVDYSNIIDRCFWQQHPHILSFS
ncbi:tRNAHis guanylyltransferase catalytic domain [Arabidopsis thaliana x Arabidopsis arenosa]|uniref:tRNA(His) guanylyltransferase n=1 Tax=Arabidopsis thaliana x Arabidopsis arenosa TaxID=1240361 RepID=A0A8T2A9L5_9BRAS|nr:tRNAHis guanylyltransferase catalytic domain [Arabidopsis thaliana x Arabidopsis arenosa]